MSTKDIAGIFNLDPYWLGAEGSSHTYRSPGPMFLVLLKLSLGPVMDVFEDVWSHAWCPGIGTRGTRIRFDRASLLRDDLATMVQAFTTGADLFPDKNEARRYMGFPALPAESWGGDDQDTIARTLQQVYLAVGKVITTDEARAIANKAGADLPIPAPVDLSAAAVQTPPTDAPETPEEPTEETTTDE